MLWARPRRYCNLEGCQNLCPEVQVEDYQLFFFDDVCLFECGGSVAWLLLLAHWEVRWTERWSVVAFLQFLLHAFHFLPYFWWFNHCPACNMCVIIDLFDDLVIENMEFALHADLLRRWSHSQQTAPLLNTFCFTYWLFWKRSFIAPLFDLT